MSLELRPSLEADAAFLTHVVIETTRDQGRLAPDFDENAFRGLYEQWSATQLDNTSVIVVDGTDAGRLRVVRTPEAIELAGIQLLPAYQGIGIGRLVLDGIKQESSSTRIPDRAQRRAGQPQGEGLLRARRLPPRRQHRHRARPPLALTGLGYAPGMLILAIILFGMIAGAAAQLLLGKPVRGIDWPLAFGAGLIGSFVGGLLISLLAGDGVDLKPSGLIGSILGAVIVTAGWLWFKRRGATTQ